MTAPRPESAVNQVMRTALKWDAIIVAAIAVVAVVLGAIFAGGVGVTSALIGAAMGLVFLGITAASILFANRYAGGELFAGIFFAIVLGGWIIKFIVFIVIAVLLRHQPWVNAYVLFLSIIAGVLGSLFVDVVVVIRSRIPIAVGPGERGRSESGEKE
ncbi:hypothetical protein GCM10022286_27220 [Gryllotalpicola daejeonensis]|uniref:ATP synthase protein I n=1 Tax=Gryllotalpicola daejeonensis TaxID=993087 RepID=A0ABP7ZMQ0_9MICO